MRQKWTFLFSAALFAASSFVLTGCSRLEWATEFADNYVAWKLNDSFDFQGESKSAVKAQSSQLVSSARRTQFPFLSKYFRESAEEFSQIDFRSQEAIEKWVQKKIEDSDRFLDSLPSEIEPFASQIAGHVTKDNWNSFLKNFEKENKKILAKKSKCAGKFSDNLEDWLGNLNENQEKAIENYCESREWSAELRVKNRRFLLETFRQWAEPEGEFDKTAFEAAVKRWVASYRKIQHPEISEKWKSSKQLLKKAFAEILVHSNETQRKRFIREITARAQSFQKLSF